MRAVLLCTAVLVVGGAWLGSACHFEQMSACPHYHYLQSHLTTVIPLPDPNALDQTCRNIAEGFRCLLGPHVLGNCGSPKAPYEAMSKTTEVPCLRNKQEYQLGRDCWMSPDLKQTMTQCNAENRQLDVCTRLQGFRLCSVERMLSVKHCGVSQQYLLDTMIVTYYNKIGLSAIPMCIELPMPTTTTTNAATTTTTITSKISTEPTSSAREATTFEEFAARTQALENTSQTAANGKAIGAATESNTKTAAVHSDSNGRTTQADSADAILETTTVCNEKGANCIGPLTKASTAHNAGSKSCSLKPVTIFIMAVLLLYTHIV